MRRSEAEQLLDLPPDDEREVGGEDQGREEDGEETQARKGPLLLPLCRIRRRVLWNRYARSTAIGSGSGGSSTASVRRAGSAIAALYKTCRVIPSRRGEVSQAALRSLAAAGQDLADAEDLDGALGVLAEAAASGVGATLAVIRVAERGGEDLQARGVWAASPALRAELEGSRIPEEKSAPKS